MGTRRGTNFPRSKCGDVEPETSCVEFPLTIRICRLVGLGNVGGTHVSEPMCLWRRKCKLLLSKRVVMPKWEHHQEEMQSLRSHPRPTESESGFTRPPDDSPAPSILRSTDDSETGMDAEQWQQVTVNKYPCDGVKLILTAFSVAEITELSGYPLPDWVFKATDKEGPIQQTYRIGRKLLSYIRKWK